jgi:hypothetical protein
VPNEQIDARFDRVLVRRWLAYGWFTGLGLGTDTLTSDVAEQVSDVTTKLNMYRRHDIAVMSLDLDMRTVDAAADEDMVLRQQRTRDLHLAELLNIRTEIRKAGWGLPVLPLTIRRTVEAAEQSRISQ